MNSNILDNTSSPNNEAGLRALMNQVGMDSESDMAAGLGSPEIPLPKVTAAHTV